MCTEIGIGGRRGRPIEIKDNFLLGRRNEWVSLLEQNWPEIGWSLISIKGNPAATIEDVRKALLPIDSINKGGLAVPFVRESSQQSDIDRLRDHRMLLSTMNDNIQKLSARVTNEQQRCGEVTELLKPEHLHDKALIEAELERRRAALIDAQEDLRQREQEQLLHEEWLRGEEAYVCQTQFLDLLLSKRCAIEPRRIANGLAGLPMMVWRYSANRCAAFPFVSPPHFTYQLFKTIAKICSRRLGQSTRPRTETFRHAILSLPKKDGTRRFLGVNWHDLKVAVSHCDDLDSFNPRLPYAISSLFFKEVSSPKQLRERLEVEKDRIIE
jgi:hypothetical protein